MSADRQFSLNHDDLRCDLVRILLLTGIRVSGSSVYRNNNSGPVEPSEDDYYDFSHDH